MSPGTSGVYHCDCRTCDYEREVFSRRKAKQARNYHKYTNPSHDVELTHVAGGVRAQELKDLQEITHGTDYEFEANYRWWMWFWQFR